MKDSVDTSKIDSKKLELTGEEHMKEDVRTELIKKPSLGRMDEGVKCSQVMREPMNPDLRTSSEEIEQSLKDNSDDIDTGLDKYLSTVEKEISKDGCHDAPDSRALFCIEKRTLMLKQWKLTVAQKI